MCWSADHKTKQFALEIWLEFTDVLVQSWCTGITSGITIHFDRSGRSYHFKATQPQQGLEDTMSGCLSLERPQSRAVFLSQLGHVGRDQFQQRVINLLREREEADCA